ncbi:hypothetical protein [Flyfo siphovirus Tbat1_6]|uniref:hypothetical protein n=1 Tax=Flyfo siphovirus Tbat1_6 TaxID=2907287 RepID=UPI00233F5612|nr:hypothetical protein PRB80_gp28 [Flyfo siphovirus Tbat1_6]UIW10275.1 hypothetical protein [Flyfo siphovirus Tbat1_6]
METTKQEVWQNAQLEGVNHFIAAIAKAFPDAIEVVHVKSPRNDLWCRSGKCDEKNRLE